MTTADDFEPFEGPKLLLSVAKENITEFEKRCIDFNQTCGASIIQQEDRKTGDHVIKVSMTKRVDPRLRKFATDILADLRHALDQATSDAALELGRKNGNGVHFPTGIDVASYEGQRKRFLQGVHTGVVAFIDALQPYKGGNGELVWALSRLTGPGKHQRPIPLGPGVNQSYDLMNGSLGGPAVIGYNQWRKDTKEFEIARIERGGHLHGNLSVSPQIVIEYPVSHRYIYAPRFASDVAGVVERIILGLEAETARIKRA